MCISSQINCEAFSSQFPRSGGWDLKVLHGIRHASAIKINALHCFENLNLQLPASGTEGMKREEKGKERMNPETFQVLIVILWHLLMIS